MARTAAFNSSHIGALRHHQQQKQSPALSSSHLDDQSPSSSLLDESSFTKDSICVKPFDRWRPLGGRPQHDIFRRFKVQPSEKEDFMLHWVRKGLSYGFITHDESGILVFRVSSADLSHLAALDIGRSDVSEPCPQWIHVYDEYGVSWLTQFRLVDLDNFPKVYDTNGHPIFARGRLGRYGPSGLTPFDFYSRMAESLGGGGVTRIQAKTE